MDETPLSSIVMAVTRGRGRRGWKSPARWIDDRSRLLTQLYVDMKPGEIRAQLQVDVHEFERQVAEACDAVLRGRGESPEADQVCAPVWVRWCKLRDAAACTRLKPIPDRPRIAASLAPDVSTSDDPRP